MADELNIVGGSDPARRLMPSLEASARGMSLQQRFLEAIARNLANAQTTRTPDGGAYQRQIAVAAGDAAGAGPAAEILQDESPGRLVYDPGHPDADASGFVEYPNVDPETELVNLMIVRRAYEANASVFQAAKAMLRRALEI